MGRQPHQQLTGSVHFSKVKQGQMLLGTLDDLSDKGLRLQGSFKAHWPKNMVMCG